MASPQQPLELKPITKVGMNLRGKQEKLPNAKYYNLDWAFLRKDVLRTPLKAKLNKTDIDNSIVSKNDDTGRKVISQITGRQSSSIYQTPERSASTYQYTPRTKTDLKTTLKTDRPGGILFEEEEIKYLQNQQLNTLDYLNDKSFDSQQPNDQVNKIIRSLFDEIDQNEQQEKSIQEIMLQYKKVYDERNNAQLRKSNGNVSKNSKLKQLSKETQRKDFSQELYQKNFPDQSGYLVDKSFIEKIRESRSLGGREEIQLSKLPYQAVYNRSINLKKEILQKLKLNNDNRYIKLKIPQSDSSKIFLQQLVQDKNFQRSQRANDSNIKSIYQLFSDYLTKEPEYSKISKRNQYIRNDIKNRLVENVQNIMKQKENSPQKEIQTRDISIEQPIIKYINDQRDSKLSNLNKNKIYDSWVYPPQKRYQVYQKKLQTRQKLQAINNHFINKHQLFYSQNDQQ